MITTLPVHYIELENIYQPLEKRGIRSLAITSCHSGCGSSTLAYSLAKRYQADGYKVLLVDLNLQNPSLDHNLAFDRQHWKAGKDCMQSICAPNKTGTHFLPAPTGSTASLTFRNHGTLSMTLQQWLEHYDRVIIDTSPINTQNYRNIPAVSICAETDATLLMIQAGLSQKSQLKDSCELLQDAKANLMGCVLNDMKHPSLADELHRENKRLARFLPWVYSKIKQWIDGSTLINLRV